MIETIMYFGIGFLTATLLGLVIIPLVHNRAVRLTRRRVEAATPLSIAEIQADKDQLRAEFAISNRRLELSVEQLKARSTGQLSELGKQAEAITLLKNELAEKAATILGQEARAGALMEQLRTLHETELALADKVAALAKATTELDERTLTTDAQRVEITALRTQVDALKVQLEHGGNDVQDSDDRLLRHRDDAGAASKELADERGENSLLRERVNDIAAEVARITMALEGPNSPIAAILAAESGGATNGSGQGRDEQRSNLADRIRALQSKASRLSPLS
jgi:chromosome segregation ATPase